MFRISPCRPSYKMAGESRWVFIWIFSKIIGNILIYAYVILDFNGDVIIVIAKIILQLIKKIPQGCIALRDEPK